MKVTCPARKSIVAMNLSRTILSIRRDFFRAQRYTPRAGMNMLNVLIQWVQHVPHQFFTIIRIFAHTGEMLGDGVQIGSHFFSTTRIRCSRYVAQFPPISTLVWYTVVRALFHFEMLWQQQHDRNGNQSLRYKVVSIQIQYKLKQWNCTTNKYSLCQMKNDPCSCECNLCNCVRSLKKFRASTGFKPVT